MSSILIIETGSCTINANSFVDSVYADTYFGNQGQATWTGTTQAKESALFRGGQYLNGLRWQGSKFNYQQIMCWPRFGVQVADMLGAVTIFPAGIGYGLYWPTNVIPEPIKFAQCEAALRYLTGTDMMPDLDRGGLESSVRLGPIQTTYEPGAPPGMTFPAIKALLKTFLKSDASVEMIRG